MIKCKLGEKEYFIDCVSGRALREMGDALKMYGKITAVSQAAVAGKEIPEEYATLDVAEALDVLVKWFCILFGNQFTPDDVYDHYPADTLMQDIVVALLAVQTQTTSILSEFPMKATQEKTQKKGK